MHKNIQNKAEEENGTHIIGSFDLLRHRALCPEINLYLINALAITRYVVRSIPHAFTNNVFICVFQIVGVLLKLAKTVLMARINYDFNESIKKVIRNCY